MILGERGGQRQRERREILRIRRKKRAPTRRVAVQRTAKEGDLLRDLAPLRVVNELYNLMSHYSGFRRRLRAVHNRDSQLITGIKSLPQASELNYW